MSFLTEIKVLFITLLWYFQLSSRLIGYSGTNPGGGAASDLILLVRGEHSYRPVPEHHYRVFILSIRLYLF